MAKQHKNEILVNKYLGNVREKLITAIVDNDMEKITAINNVLAGRITVISTFLDALKIARCKDGVPTNTTVIVTGEWNKFLQNRSFKKSKTGLTMISNQKLQ
jgi:hypothetical protein